MASVTVRNLPDETHRNFMQHCAPALVPPGRPLHPQMAVLLPLR